MIMYPSISICKKYAFETLVFETGEENIDINHLVQSVQKHTWGLDQLFYFFTHPGSLNKSFPCTTTLGGTTPGRPCIFPGIADGWLMPLPALGGTLIGGSFPPTAVVVGEISEAVTETPGLDCPGRGSCPGWTMDKEGCC